MLIFYDFPIHDYHLAPKLMQMFVVIDYDTLSTCRAIRHLKGIIFVYFTCLFISGLLFEGVGEY